MTTMVENVRRQRIAFALYHRGMSYREIANLLDVSYQVARSLVKPAQRAAQISLNKALTDGLIEKADACQECGATNVRLTGHHEDYNDLYGVRWLCYSCHKRIHPGSHREALPGWKEAVPA